MLARLLKAAVTAALALCIWPAMAQDLTPASTTTNIPELPFKRVEGFFKYPPHYDLSRMSGVAVGPQGRIVAVNRGNHPVLEFKADGTFIGSWGEGSRLFDAVHVPRFDPQGNLWMVFAGDNVIYRFDKEGRTAGILGIDEEPWTFLTHVIQYAARGKTAFYQPTDIGWSKDGHIYVSDGYGNSRVAEFDPNGNFVKEWGERGSQPGQFNTPHSLVIDDNDTIYVADRQNNRIQSFDTDGNLKQIWRLPGPAWALCLTPGPRQVMYAGSIGKIFKIDMATGKIIGQFGHMGRFLNTIDSIHQIACPDEKTLYFVNLFSSRLDKWVSP